MNVDSPSCVGLRRKQRSRSPIPATRVSLEDLQNKFAPQPFIPPPGGAMGAGWWTAHDLRADVSQILRSGG